MKTYFVSKCFELVTEESAANGDFADHGFVWEDVSMDIEEIEQEIREQGYSELSSSYIPNNDDVCREWMITVDPEQTWRHFEKGEDKYYSLHIQGMTNRDFLSICHTAGIKVSTY